jgi:basic membrane protein A
MRDFFFQIVLFLVGAVIGIAVPLLEKPIQKRIATILAIVLVSAGLLWAGYEIGAREANGTVIANDPTDTPTATLESSTNTPTPTEPTLTPTPVENSPSPVATSTFTPEPPTDTPVLPTNTYTPEPPVSAPSTARRYGMVVGGTGGVDDNGFNQIAWEGMVQAEEQLGVEVSVLESQQESDYQTNMNQFVQQGYNGVVAVGFLLAEAAQAVSQANPNIPIAIVDFPNQTNGTMGLLFAVDQPSFLAGYLAAGMTRTGTVCTFGGLQITPVTQFMVGFEQGVIHYNRQHGTNVQVRGWTTDPTQEGGGQGIFVNNFDNTADGRRQAEDCFNAGGDIIFPVAGQVGIGSAEVAQEQGRMMIGVDTDYYHHVPEYQESYLTSVQKNLDQAVYDAIQAMENGTFQGGSNYLGTLQNGGVGLAPFHNFDDDIPDDLKAELADLANAISTDQISTGWQ